MKPFRRLVIPTAMGIAAWLAWRAFRPEPAARPALAPDGPHAVVPPAPLPALPAELLLEGYADPASAPVEDLRKIHRVATGYFSVVKDRSRQPIGGNADLAAALRGENPNHEVFVRAGHRVFAADGLLVDRWGSPLVVHPEAWSQLELRSAGPDRVPFTADDVVLTPAGLLPREQK